MEKQRLEQPVTRENSMVLIEESVYSLNEYASDKLLIALQMTDLLIIDCWKAINIIKDPRAGNIEKFWIDTLPGFKDS